MNKYALYGDAKASARQGDGQRKQRGLAAAQQAFDADPSAPNRMALASALFDLGRFADAEQHLSALRSSGGTDPNLLFELGFIYKNLNKNDEAQKIWHELIEANPKHPLAHAAASEIWRMDPSYKPSWLRK